MFIERNLVTVGKEENISGVVAFPYNEDELFERFQIEDAKELRFMDRPESKMTVATFNLIMRDADDRMSKIESQIDTVVKFLKGKMKKNKGAGWKKISDTIPLNFYDSVVWQWCMKDTYVPKDELTKVWRHGNELTVLYGAGEAEK